MRTGTERKVGAVAEPLLIEYRGDELRELVLLDAVDALGGDGEVGLGDAGETLRLPLDPVFFISVFVLVLVFEG